jgi:multidrug efflux system membrane fusion protein
MAGTFNRQKFLLPAERSNEPRRPGIWYLAFADSLRLQKRNRSMAAQRWRLGWVLVASGVTLVALVAWIVFHKRPAAAPKPQPVSVSVAEATIQDVSVSITALGAAQAWTSVNVLAQVSGLLRSVDFVEGTDVKAGQLLAQVDPSPYRAALTQAQGAAKRDQALLEGASVDLARYQVLAAQDSIARQTLEDEAALVEQFKGTVLLDKGAVDTARINLGWCRITSPIAGRVGVRLIDPGNLVSAGGASSTTSGAAGTASSAGIVVVNKIKPIAVTFSIPQGDYQHLWDVSNGFRKPLATQAISQDTGASLGTGVLSIANNRVDPTTGTVEMKARFANADERLLPGQFVNIELTLQTLLRATTIPAAALNKGPNGFFAYVVGADHKVSMRAIKVTLTQGETVVIAGGLESGEAVVTDGQMSLYEGSLVKVAPPAAAKPPAR